MIRTADGHLRKESPKVTEAIEANLIKIKTALTRAEIMKTLKEHPGWIAIQQILNERIKSLDRALDKFMDSEHRQNDLKMQERRDMRYFVAIVDDFIDRIPVFEQEADQYQKELDARRKPANSAG